MQSFSPKLVLSLANRLRHHSPLIHCLTNQVVSNFSANVLLAIGATPAMVVAEEEVGHFVLHHADALSINVGTVDATQRRSILIAVAAANRANKSWVLDPVGVGALNYRSELVRELIKNGKPTAIHCNASEMLWLANGHISGRGPDSTTSSDAAVEEAKIFAKDNCTVVALTGTTDYITDGITTISLSNGSPLQRLVTGMGCSLTDIIAAFIAIKSDKEKTLLAVAAATAYVGIAGEMAAKRSKGPGSFAVAYLDCLSSIDEKELERIKYREL